jgi:hypothetical protein
MIQRATILLVLVVVWFATGIGIYALGTLIWGTSTTNPADQAVLAITICVFGGLEAALLVVRHELRAMKPAVPGIDGYVRKGGLYAGTIRGRVEGLTAALDGPDGRGPCIAALRWNERLRGQSRWAPFVVDLGGDRIVVDLLYPTAVRELRPSSWAHIAAWPRWFGTHAWRPDLSPRLDWVCLRDGDLVEIRFDDVDLPSKPTVALRGTVPSRVEEMAAERGLPIFWLRAHDTVSFELEILAPNYSVEWKQRSLRFAFAVWCVLAIGGCSLAWGTRALAYQADSVAGWLLSIVGAMMLVWPAGVIVSVIYVASSGRWESPWDDAEMPAESRQQRWIDLAARRRWFWALAAALVLVSISSWIFGFHGFLVAVGALASVGFAFAMIAGAPRQS